MTVGELNLAWLHCNECHRSFEHHNRLAEDPGDGLRVLRSDLVFSFTSCGHFFCEGSITGKFICSLCQSDATVFRIDNAVPKTLEMYVKPPISQLEDSISVMTGLRAKVAQQKELISKAKQELAGQKLLKEYKGSEHLIRDRKLNELQQENERLCRKLDDVTRAAGGDSEPAPLRPTQSPAPAIHVPGRLSLRSPMRTSQQPPMINVQPMRQSVGQPNTGWSVPRSPTVSEIYVRHPSERIWSQAHQQPQPQPQYYDFAHHEQLTRPVYNTPTPDSRTSRTFPQPPRTVHAPSRTRNLPPSPRPVNRQQTDYARIIYPDSGHYSHVGTI